MRLGKLLHTYPFLRPCFPFSREAIEFALSQSESLPTDSKLTAIVCHPVLPRAEARLLTALRLMSLPGAFRMFGAYEVVQMFLGQHDQYASPSRVRAPNLVIEMTGNETHNRKMEEFCITMMEMQANRSGTCTFVVSAPEERWSKIRMFMASSRYSVVSVDLPALLRDTVSRETFLVETSFAKRNDTPKKTPMYTE